MSRLKEIGSDELEIMCRAHDAEDAARKGEPSPWDFVEQDGKVDAEWVSERLCSMRMAVNALMKHQENSK